MLIGKPNKGDAGRESRGPCDRIFLVFRGISVHSVAFHLTVLIPEDMVVHSLLQTRAAFGLVRKGV